MTVKTIQPASNLTIKASRSDMQKRGAVKNLFGTTVDRVELQEQLKQLNNESNQALERYDLESVIGVIDSANYQPRKLKRCIESDDSSSEDEEEPQRILPPSEPLSSDEPSSSSSSQTSSSKKPDVKLVQQRIPLPRGQKTLKGEIRRRKLFHPNHPPNAFPLSQLVQQPLLTFFLSLQF